MSKKRRSVRFGCVGMGCTRRLHNRYSLPADRPIPPAASTAAIRSNAGTGSISRPFHGNSMTSRDFGRGLHALSRCPLTLQSGYDWLLVVDRNTEHDVRNVRPAGSILPPMAGPGYGLLAT